MTEDQQEEGVVHRQHPLKNTWTYWYLNDDRQADWEQRLKKVCAVKTVEEFWALQNNIRPPSSLAHSCDYNFFKNEIQPMWEVPENNNGGRWLINIEKGKPGGIMDLIWLEVILSMIGEQYGDDMENICGLVCNVRAKGSKISMWTRNHNDDDSNMRIGKVIARTLMTAEVPEQLKGHFPLADVLRYEDHASCQKKSGSTVKPKLTIPLGEQQ
ncbi:unnamed protein product, partial [Mesorhabditis belari]|uniref:eIF-4F 25 kDa subunit n=1 Tax=Mesorhabditis belari TaxID=2138241 RepID=A0AAF3FJ31_9BILA